MFIQINREELTQLPTDHNKVSTINECMYHQPHGITKWPWTGRNRDRLQ